MNTETKDAQGGPAKMGSGGKGFSVGLDADAHRHVMAQAKKLNVSKQKYASAAIAYFAQTGIDPTKEQPKGLANVSVKVDQSELAVRKQNHEIGTRLIQIIRTWEKNLYTFLQQQQAANNNYLAHIETNVLQHQVTVESNLLAPMVEHLFRVNQEATTTRGLATRLFIEATKKPDSAKTTTERYQEQKAQLDSERDFLLTNQLREFLKTNPVPLPKVSPKPAVTPVPVAPLQPASPTPAGAAKP